MSTNDPQQQQMIREAMKSTAERRPGRTKLVYDKMKRTIVAVAEGAQAPRALNITADDADMFAALTLSTEWLRDHWDNLARDRYALLSLSSWDNGDALTHAVLGVIPAASSATGCITLDPAFQLPQGTAIAIVLQPGSGEKPDAATFTCPDGTAYRTTAWRQDGDTRLPLDVCFADVQPELATRRSGILETTVLKDKTVVVIGLGTGGGHAAIELAKCGVGNFILIDRDRLSVGNVVRHPGGISQVGRFKVNVIRDLILEKNPDAKVSAHPVAVDYDNQGDIRELIAQADVVVCGTDSRPSKLLVNQLCVEAGVVAVYGGAFRRAYGGQVLRVRPKDSACHQCFVAAMPDKAADVEVSTAEDAESIAYSDQPVAIEPGLSLDVLPIANMVAKLALLELLADRDSSLNILKRDFAAPWYLWLNRPEPGTEYASWPPLSESMDEMTIHRWYGIELPRDEECSACGNFLSALAGNYAFCRCASGPAGLPGKGSLTVELASDFKALLSSIEPTDQHVANAKAAHETFRQQLRTDSEFKEAHKETFLSGSYARHTAINDINDVDVICVVDIDRYNTPAELVLAWTESIRAKYYKVTKRQGRSVGVQAAKGVWLDIVPATPISDDDGPLWIPDREAKEWVATHPKGQIKAATDKNKVTNGYYVQVVKLMKYWRDQLPTEPCKPKSYILESMVHRTIASPASHAAGVVNVLEGIESSYGAHRGTGVVPLIPDPGYASVNVAKHWEPAEFNAFMNQVKAAAVTARKALDSKDEAESRKVWRQIFGSKFGQ